MESRLVEFDGTLPVEVVAKITSEGVEIIRVVVDGYNCQYNLNDTTLDELRELALEQD